MSLFEIAGNNYFVSVRIFIAFSSFHSSYEMIQLLLLASIECPRPCSSIENIIEFYDGPVTRQDRAQIMFEQQRSKSLSRSCSRINSTHFLPYHTRSRAIYSMHHWSFRTANVVARTALKTFTPIRRAASSSSLSLSLSLSLSPSPS